MELSVVMSVYNEEKYLQDSLDSVLMNSFRNFEFIVIDDGSSDKSSEILRVARGNLNIHLSYIEYLLESKRYLAGDQISVADFSAACHISVLDYFGDINWHHYLPAKDWYSMIKSHKIFGEILKDRIPGLVPVEWYSQLDF